MVSISGRINCTREWNGPEIPLRGFSAWHQCPNPKFAPWYSQQCVLQTRFACVVGKTGHFWKTSPLGPANTGPFHETYIHAVLLSDTFTFSQFWMSDKIGQSDSGASSVLRERLAELQETSHAKFQPLKQWPDWKRARGNFLIPFHSVFMHSSYMIIENKRKKNLPCLVIVMPYSFIHC